MDDEQADDWANGGGVKVERSVEVFPGRHIRGKGRLAGEVQDEFGFWRELVPEEVGEGIIDAGDIACLSILRRCTSSGTSWKVQFHSSTMVQQYSALSSLSRSWISTMWPLNLRQGMMLF